MPFDPLQSIPYEPEEHGVRCWAVDAVELEGVEGTSGWLVLTNQRILFGRREGWFGKQLSMDRGRAVRLEAMRYAGLRPFLMRVGLAERGNVPGIEIDGRGYRTGREPPPSTILVAIARERVRRREAAGLVGDVAECAACGTYSFPWSKACLHCGRNLSARGSSPAASL
jgi:hypothetical protein